MTDQTRVQQTVVGICANGHQALTYLRQEGSAPITSARRAHGNRIFAGGTMNWDELTPAGKAARLGHSVMELMKTYAHALLHQQQAAAVRLGALLHG